MQYSQGLIEQLILLDIKLVAGLCRLGGYVGNTEY